MTMPAPRRSPGEDADDLLHVLRHPLPTFGQHRKVGVVVEQDRPSQAAAERGGDGDVGQARQVLRVGGRADSPAGTDGGGHAGTQVALTSPAPLLRTAERRPARPSAPSQPNAGGVVGGQLDDGFGERAALQVGEHRRDLPLPEVQADDAAVVGGERVAAGGASRPSLPVGSAPVELDHPAQVDQLAPQMPRAPSGAESRVAVMISDPVTGPVDINRSRTAAALIHAAVPGVTVSRSVIPARRSPQGLRCQHTAGTLISAQLTRLRFRRGVLHQPSPPHARSLGCWP